jgi:hypothetical protein
MKKKAIKSTVSWKDKIIEPKTIKQDGVKFTLKPNYMQVIKEEDDG